MDRLEELLDELREELVNRAVDKNVKIPKSKNLASGKIDKKFDIEIVFIRKPGMRRSVQLIASGTTKPEDIKMSCTAAICSLCDTMLENKQLNVNKEDIVRAFIAWMETNGIRLVNTKDI